MNGDTLKSDLMGEAAYNAFHITGKEAPCWRTLTWKEKEPWVQAATAVIKESKELKHYI
jgi:hypothetical protein